MTPLGELLLEEMMRRGMIADLSHLPRKAYGRAYEILAQNDYPASDTHGRDNNGVLYTLGGISQSGFARCRDQNVPATSDDGFQNKLQRVIDNGGYPAVPFGFDLNGFAGAQAPRFGPRGCTNEQRDPVTYPFTSYAGDVTFHQPRIGNRLLDFNTEGFVHIGLVAEMIQDVRGDGVSDAEIEPLFRSAEAYVRMWEKAERRSADIR
jgi:microsomal dipeptidase-like Zn-dependent dipeptidase